MKRLFAVVLLLSCLPLFAATVDNTITFSDHTGSPQAVKRVVVTPLTWGLYNGTNIALAIPITKQTDASGSVTVSNLASGYSYRVQLFNSALTELGRFTNSFGTNVSGAVFARDYLTISTNLAGGTTAYSRDAADARFQPLSTNLTGWALIPTNQLSGGGSTINTNLFVLTNAWAATNALKADLASLTIAATNAGAFVAATNGAAYNLTIASGNGRGLTNLQSTNIVGSDLTLALDVANSESSAVISEQAGLNVTHLENATNSYTWGAGGGAIFSQLLYSSSITNATYSGSGIFSGIWNSTNVSIFSGGLGCLVNAGTHYATNSVLNANQGGLIQGFLFNSTDVFLTSTYGAVLGVGTIGSSNIVVDAQSAGVFVQANGANSSVTAYRSVVTGNVPSNSTNTFTDTIAVFRPDGLKYALLGTTASNGGGLTNLQATNIVFQDKVWSGTEINDYSNAILELNNGYQRYEFGIDNFFTITGITPTATGKPRWTSLKLLNSFSGNIQLNINIAGARAIGSASPFTIPQDKVAWITIHDDGQGTAWSITYAVAIEP